MLEFLATLRRKSRFGVGRLMVAVAVVGTIAALSSRLVARWLLAELGEPNRTPILDPIPGEFGPGWPLPAAGVPAPGTPTP